MLAELFSKGDVLRGLIIYFRKLSYKWGTIHLYTMVTEVNLPHNKCKGIHVYTHCMLYPLYDEIRYVFIVSWMEYENKCSPCPLSTIQSPLSVNLAVLTPKKQLKIIVIFCVPPFAPIGKGKIILYRSKQLFLNRVLNIFN